MISIGMFLSMAFSAGSPFYKKEKRDLVLLYHFLHCGAISVPGRHAVHRSGIARPIESGEVSGSATSFAMGRGGVGLLVLFPPFVG